MILLLERPSDTLETKILPGCQNIEEPLDLIKTEPETLNYTLLKHYVILCTYVVHANSLEHRYEFSSGNLKAG